MNKKHYIYMILLIGSIFLNGCDDSTIWIWDSEEVKKTKRIKQEQELEKIRTSIQSFMDYSNKEITVLLSYKYSIPEETTLQLLKDYTEQCKPTDEIMIEAFIENIPVVSKHKEVLNKLSSKYNVPKEKLASMIIDYRLFGKKYLEE